MMNKRFLHPATLFFLLTLLVALLSWVGNIYGWQGVQNLLSTEGLRWKLRTVENNFLNAPWLGHWLLLAFGVGLCLHSGWWAFCRQTVLLRKKPTRKERRAFLFSLAVGTVCALALGLMAFGPWGVVRSITGSLSGSPLQDGCCYLISIGLGMTAIVYGYGTDYYRSDRDIARGMSYAFVRFPSYFVTLFFVVQFFSSLHYTGLDTFCGISPGVFRGAYHLCSVLPLLTGSKEDCR